MTQIVLNIEDTSLVPSLKQILGAIKGVTIDRLGTNTSVAEAEKQEDPTLISREEFYASLDRGEAQYKQGKTHRINSVAELKTFLNNL